MPEYGLTLPEHDLTATEFKELARRIGRAAFVPLFLRFYERVVTSEATIEEQRKALADIGRWTGVEEDRKLDPNANLPVFNIVFGSSGGMTAEIVAPAIEATPPALGLPDALPLFDPAALSDPAAVKLIHRLMEAPDDQDPPASDAPPDRGGSPAGPQERHRARREGRPEDHAGEQPEPVRDALRAAPGLPGEDGAPKLGQPEPPPEMTMDEHLADLDRLLGL